MTLKQSPCARDGDRNDRCAGLDGDAERAVLELTGTALLTLVTGAFREDDKAFAALHDGGRVVQGADGSADIVTLDKYAAQQFHPAVEERDLLQLFLGEDAVGRVKARQQQRNVVVAAVVAHKDAGGVLRDVFQTGDGQLDAGDL